MTDEPSSMAALDAVVRQTRHLLFAFDGPVRSAVGRALENSAVVAAPPAPYIQEALSACRESGRPAAVIGGSPPADIWAYLDAHDLSAQITAVAATIGEAATALEASLTECTVITRSLGDIEEAQASGALTIGYARTPDDADHLVHAGAGAFIYSMADLALRLRARPVDREL
jgi:beta-phosphoglucomutase-like phosphatase (HAD superfamily)